MRRRTAWHAALRHDPRVPEAGWLLLELFYLQGRTEEARRLALRLHAIEPDPGDRVRYLLELLRQDAHPPAPASLVNWFRPIVANNPDEVHARLALGVALARSSSIKEGMEVLRPVLENSPESPEGWEAWLTSARRIGRSRTSSRLRSITSPEHSPIVLDLPGFERGSSKNGAIGSPPNANIVSPFRPLLPTIAFNIASSEFSGTTDGPRRPSESNVLIKTYLTAKDETLPVYDEANAIENHGHKPHRALYQRIADLRERLGLRDEALAWHRLVLLDEPQNARSLAKASELSQSGANSSDER